jgi:hypothetical protein
VEGVEEGYKEFKERRGGKMMGIEMEGVREEE